MRIACLACEGTGIGTGTRANFGELMALCQRCDGLRTIEDGPRIDPPFVAIWPVSTRYAVYMQVPRKKGGFVELDIEWQPRLPPERGPGRLKVRRVPAELERFPVIHCGVPSVPGRTRSRRGRRNAGPARPDRGCRRQPCLAAKRHRS